MLEQLVILITAAILGIMIFFSFVVAPITFTALNEENARKFIRKIFPHYYNLNFILSASITLIYIIQKYITLPFISFYLLQFYFLYLIMF